MSSRAKSLKKEGGLECVDIDDLTDKVQMGRASG